jgi:hypothetical protein
MKSKRSWKIGLSLLVALSFILPTASVFGGSTVDESEASGIKTFDNVQAADYIKLPSDGVISQDPGDVTIRGGFFENPAGDYIDVIPDITIPIEEWYQPWIVLDNEPGNGVASVKPHLELYRLTDGVETILYETSFEDNFDNYNNWVQIDEDCGYGGYIDSFSWSDARASDGQYSFKSTMYDIYKGNQDDYLQCTKSFDISDCYKINVSFDIWVEGQDDGGSPPAFYDYLSFEVWDDGAWYNPNVLTDFGYIQYLFSDTTRQLYDYGYNLTGIAKDMGNGWWHVWCELPRSWFLDPTDVQFRFDWHTDPQFQFEGAYVDNFKVVCIDDVQTKIFQTHSQGPIDLEECQRGFEFPLKWTDVEEGCYEMILWCEVEDPNHQAMNDWDDRVIIDFCVGDNYDCEITDMFVEDSFTGVHVADGGRMTQGADAHIVFDFHLGGNMPLSNIPIKASAKRLYWEEIYFADFESLGWPDTGSFDGPDLWHQTTFDSWNGNKALACFDSDTKHYANGMYYNYALGPTVDLEGRTEVYMDFYTKWCVEEGGDDNLKYLFFDSTTNYVLSMSTSAYWNDYQPTWIGPMQPQSVYQPFNVLANYNFWHTSYGMFTNADGTQNYDVQIGFAAFTNDTGYTNAQAESNGEYWSGWLFDDISIRSLTIGEEVWTESMVLPGPFEPCDTVTAQFEWENVPYSNYLICVQTCCDEDVEEDNNMICQEIMVIDDLEKATEPKVDADDLTGVSGGEWGICTSDYDNYLSTNNQDVEYEAGMNAIAQLCPDGETCIDISHLWDDEYWDISTGTILPLENFNSGIPGTWTIQNLGGDCVWTDNGAVGRTNYAGGDGLCACADSDDCGSGTSMYTRLVTPLIDATAYTAVELQYIAAFNYLSGDYFDLQITTDGSTWTTLLHWAEDHDDYGPGEDVTVDLTAYAGQLFYIGWLYEGSYDWYAEIDDVVIIGNGLVVVSGGPPSPPAYLDMTFDTWFELEPGFDYVVVEIADCPADQMVDWYAIDIFDGFSGDDPSADGDDWINDYTINLGYWIHNLGLTGDQIEVRFRMVSDSSGQYRGMLIDDLHISDLFDVTTPADPNPVFEDFDDPMDTLDNWCSYVMQYGSYWNWMGGYEWCNDFPALPINDALVWATEIADAYYAELTFHSEHDFSGGAIGYVEISADGGSNWFILEKYEDAGSSDEVFDLTFWAGSSILIRFRVAGDSASGAGSWCVSDIEIAGKIDAEAPSSTHTLSGTRVQGWFITPVTVTINAVDEGAGMGEIHYRVDGGSESVVSGSQATFTVSSNGVHTVEYWAVDNTGNEETPHNFVDPFQIDAGSPPTVSITGPEPGLYLFGNKLLSLSKVFIIGAFTAEAQASDAESGVYVVQFYLDDELVAEDTESPYSAYIAEKHMGAGTLKVIAEDGVGNTAEDSMDITYYKFL